jgi:hypothetical protein
MGGVVDSVYQKWRLFVDLLELEYAARPSCHVNDGVPHLDSASLT